MAKGVTPFGIGISRCYPFFLGQASCVPNNTLCELYGVKDWEGLVKLMELSRISQKMSMCFIFGVPSWLYSILHSVLWRVLQNLIRV